MEQNVSNSDIHLSNRTAKSILSLSMYLFCVVNVYWTGSALTYVFITLSEISSSSLHISEGMIVLQVWYPVQCQLSQCRMHKQLLYLETLKLIFNQKKNLSKCLCHAHL